jgi:catechol 2,3-dioxygenase-like lactoylglutathione lyase family enzyme
MLSKSFSVALMVTDAKKSAKWYEEKLGFVTEGSGHWITVWPKGSNSKFHLCEGKPEPGNTGISLYCESAEKTAAALEKKGVKFAKHVTKEEWGTFAIIADPDGNEIWLNEGSP